METTVGRSEQFRQLREQVRGATRHLIVGIDVDKEKHHAFLGTATGKSLFRRVVFDNRIAGFDKLLIQIEAVRVRHGLDLVVVGMEPTANYHKPLMAYLVKAGHMVVLVSTVAVKHNRRLFDGRWDKNDTKDAANVADLVGQGKCQTVDVPSDDVGQLRCLPPPGMPVAITALLIGPSLNATSIHSARSCSASRTVLARTSGVLPVSRLVDLGSTGLDKLGRSDG